MTDTAVLHRYDFKNSNEDFQPNTISVMIPVVMILSINNRIRLSDWIKIVKENNAPITAPDIIR